MTLSALGIFSAAGAGGATPAGSYDLIESQILSSSTPSITFSSLGTYSSTYKHLQIRLTAKDNRPSGTSSRLYLRVNGATTNYQNHVIGGDGSTAYGGVGFATNRIVIESATGPLATDNYGVAIIDLLDVYATKNKVIRATAGLLVSGYNVVNFYSGAWFDTTALSSITIGGDFGDLLAGSRFSLYGIKG